MQESRRLLIFVLDERLFSVDLSMVVRVARMVEITPLPQAPDVVLGLINLQGQIIPVLSMRKRFGLPERPPHVNDRLIMLRLSERVVALVVDEVIDVVQASNRELVTSEKLFPGIHAVEGVMKHKEKIVLIQDMERFLLVDDERKLGEAMRDLGELQP